MYEMIKARMTEALPFVRLVGANVVEVGPSSASVTLVQRDEVSNHIGSLHAGALFTLGETASGAAMMGVFAALLPTLRPLATGATITYQKIARGEVTARASVNATAESLLGRLEVEGKVGFDVGVLLADANGVTVAEMTVAWLVSKK